MKKFFSTLVVVLFAVSLSFAATAKKETKADPKADSKKACVEAFAKCEKDAGKVLTYNESTHLKKVESTEVKNFGDDNGDFNVPSKSSSDFSLD